MHSALSRWWLLPMVRFCVSMELVLWSYNRIKSTTIFLKEINSIDSSFQYCFYFSQESLWQCHRLGEIPKMHSKDRKRTDSTTPRQLIALVLYTYYKHAAILVRQAVVMMNTPFFLPDGWRKRRPSPFIQQTASVARVAHNSSTSSEFFFFFFLLFFL